MIVILATSETCIIEDESARSSNYKISWFSSSDARGAGFQCAGQDYV